MDDKMFNKTLCKILCLVLIMGISAIRDIDAQNPPITYKIDIIPLPPDVDINPSVTGISNLGMAIGVYRLLPEAGGNLEGFLYDQPNDTFYNLSQLPSIQSQIPANWSIKWPDAINDSGDVLLEIKDTSGNENIAVMETGLSSDPNDWIVTVLPDLGSSKVWGADINSVGDVVAVYHRPDGTRDIYVYNPWLDTPSNPNPPISLDIQNASSAAFINDLGQVNGVDKNTPGVAFVFDLATSAFQYFDVNSKSSQPITGTKGFNDAGVFCGNVRFDQSNESRVYRYTNQLEIIPWNNGGFLYSGGLNNSGDLALNHSWDQPWRFGTLNFGDVYLLHTGYSPDFTEMNWNLDDLIDENDSLKDFWLNEDTNKWVFRDGVSDRSDSNDASGYPQLACGVKTITIRRNRVTVVDDLVILSPISPPAPTPGISVSPTSGLTTTEAGGTDSFNVRLDAEPSGAVTVSVNSLDPTEGITNVSSLTFDQFDWNLDKMVTVTGVQDSEYDPDNTYYIEVANASTTVQVEVTNVGDDDDMPPGGGTYDFPEPLESLPMPIPDRSTVLSTIVVPVTDNFQIANMTVTLDISHQRPSDLRVKLIGPNNEEVQLSNFTGDNNVSGYNDTWTADTTWILEVRDVKKKKIGTLNGWSITVETQ